MAEERNHTYSMDGVSFRLYEDPALADPVALQQRLANKPGANHGLRFTKFFGRWATDEREKPQENGLVLLRQVCERKEVRRKRQGAWVWKLTDGWVPTNEVLDWLDPDTPPGTRQTGAHANLKVGDASALKEANNRTAALALTRARAVLGEDITQAHVTLKMTLVSRLLTGIGLPHPTENGFLFHPTLAVPYLRGTALKQVARDRAEAEGAEPETLAHLFGSAENAGCIAFLDALPTGPVTLTAEQITSHYGDYYGQDPFACARVEPGDWHEPNPVTLLAMEKGPEFRISILPLAIGKVPPTTEDLNQVLEWLAEGLEFDGIGARTTLGFGRLADTNKLNAAAESKHAEWLDGLKDGDEADFYGQLVRVRDINRDEGKAGLVNIEKNKSLGRKPLEKLKPYKGHT